MKRYRVSWVNLLTGSIRSSKVLIVEGESTVDDIPRILATRYLHEGAQSFVQVLDIRSL